LSLAEETAVSCPFLKGVVSVAKYIYPAIFTLEGNTYNVAVPDLTGALHAAKRSSML